MKDTKKNIILAAAMILCLLGSSMAGAQQIADLDVGSNSVIWHPLTGDKMVLTMSGPAGDFRHEFAAGEKPALDIFNKAGDLLADGNYTWQLTSLPEVSAETRAAIQKSRDEGLRFNGNVAKSVTQSGYLTIKDGYFVLPEKEAAAPRQDVVPNKDQVIADDLIVQGSGCFGLDCVNGESFGFDTIRLKENNLRIKFQDTSATASFPGNDWQITANDSDNGGANKFSIDDIDGGRTPFTIEASAPTNSLYVDDGGRVGLGTATPVVELHIPNGDTPTVRLEQDGSSGFTPQTWDMAGNETNWFVRDATNGSRLPLKILPNSPTNSIVIEGSTGDIGVGTASPSSALHIIRGNGTARIHVDENETGASDGTALIQLDTASTSGVTTMIDMEALAGARPRIQIGSAAQVWRHDILASGSYSINSRTTPTTIFEYRTNGDLSIAGNFISNTTTLMVPDYVFADDYELMPLDEVKAFIDKESHLPDVPSAKEVEAKGHNISEMQLRLLQKVEELTLYTLDQHETIQGLQDTVQQLKNEMAQMQGAGQ